MSFTFLCIHSPQPHTHRFVHSIIFITTAICSLHRRFGRVRLGLRQEKQLHARRDGRRWSRPIRCGFTEQLACARHESGRSSLVRGGGRRWGRAVVCRGSVHREPGFGQGRRDVESLYEGSGHVQGGSLCLGGGHECGGCHVQIGWRNGIRQILGGFSWSTQEGLV